MSVVQVKVPAGIAVGQPFMIQTPDGQQMQVQAQVPEGQVMQVQVPDVGSAAEVAPTPSTIDRAALVEIVRGGGTLHGEKQAKPYANSLEIFKEEDTGRERLQKSLTGFFCIKLGQCQIPLAITYNFIPFGWDDFYCFPTCLPLPMLVPVPVCGCCALGEFLENVYHLKGGWGKDGNQREQSELGELMVIDEERGTLACYPYACCGGGKLAEHPCVTCSRVF